VVALKENGRLDIVGPRRRSRNGHPLAQGPRALSALYLVGGSASLFVYRAQDIEPTLVMLGVVVCTWLGFVLWKARPAEKQAFESEASQHAS